MRIDLVAEEKKRRSRRKRRRRSRTFEESITLPQVQRGRSTTRSPKSAKRRKTKTRQQVIGPESAAPAPARKAIQWRAILARVPALLLLAALIAGIVYVSVDAQFFVYEAGIVGAHHVTAETIYETSGVNEQNIFWVRSQKVAERIMQIDGIKAVRVDCRLPARVTIEVEEREPRILWRCLSEQHDWWLDEEGMVLPYHGDVNAPETVFVVDSSQCSLEVGNHVKPDGIVQSVKKLTEALPEVKVYFYRTDRGLSYLHEVGGKEWPVFLGTSVDLVRKLEILQTLTKYLTAHNIQPRYVDVRWADHPVYGQPLDEDGGGGQ